MNQQQGPLVSRLHGLRDRVRSRLGAETDDTVEPTDDAEATESKLFHCEQCGIVFIATEKETCANCEDEVEQVRSTLSCR